ncbi:unnamed protein product [Phytophthora fragariaefolia]|uniref:Unnamed protein product n=1 Tax=Phytophthora fragariaefolia TaxID=1490495 RepID=A0A9W6YGS2_9STRA|nr:unnamed protein product [Phytophthora fragariaefolia]
MASHRVASGRSTEEFSAESTGPLPWKSPSQWDPTSATPAGRTHRVPPLTQMEERPGTEDPLQPRQVELVSAHGKGARPSEDPKSGAESPSQRETSQYDQAAPTSFRHQLTSGGELSESTAPLRRPRLTEVGCEGAEEAELSGGDVEPIAESSALWRTPR